MPFGSISARRTDDAHDLLQRVLDLERRRRGHPPGWPETEWAWLLADIREHLDIAIAEGRS